MRLRDKDKLHMLAKVRKKKTNIFLLLLTSEMPNLLVVGKAARDQRQQHSTNISRLFKLIFLLYENDAMFIHSFRVGEM